MLAPSKTRGIAVLYSASLFDLRVRPSVPFVCPLPSPRPGNELCINVRCVVDTADIHHHPKSPSLPLAFLHAAGCPRVLCFDLYLFVTFPFTSWWIPVVLHPSSPTLRCGSPPPVNTCAHPDFVLSSRWAHFPHFPAHHGLRLYRHCPPSCALYLWLSGWVPRSTVFAAFLHVHILFLFNPAMDLCILPQLSFL
jgi:hypothetical protein